MILKLDCKIMAINVHKIQVKFEFWYFLINSGHSFDVINSVMNNE